MVWGVYPEVKTTFKVTIFRFFDFWPTMAIFKISYPMYSRVGQIQKKTGHPSRTRGHGTKNPENNVILFEEKFTVGRFTPNWSCKVSSRAGQFPIKNPPTH